MERGEGSGDGPEIADSNSRFDLASLSESWPKVNLKMYDVLCRIIFKA